MLKHWVRALHTLQGSTWMPDVPEWQQRIISQVLPHSQHLFPLVSRLGAVTIDDYGYWEAARKATDEYLVAHGILALLHRIDYSGRQFIKS